jgi:hypothetical protein
VHPITGKCPPGKGFRLGDFVFMMREDQVVSTAMNVDLFAQVV